MGWVRVMKFHRIARMLVLILILGTFEFVFISPAYAATYSFTNAGATGANGPTQAQVTSAYSSTKLNGAVTVGTQGYQTWIVPTTGSYVFTVAGAAGGSGNNGTALGGNGVVASSTINLVQGDSITIVVGQSGLASSLSAGGGGGGSFVVGSGSVNGLMIAAGGGGGAGKNGSGVDASTTTSAAGATFGSFGGTTNAAGATNNGYSTLFGGSGGGAVGTFASNLLTKKRETNTATITTSTAHGFTVNKQVFLYGVGDNFDGNWKILTPPNSTTFTFNQYTTDFALASATGKTLVGSNGIAGAGSGGLGGGGGAGYGGVGGKSNNASETGVARSYLVGAKGGIQTTALYGDENSAAGGFGGGGTGTIVSGNNGGGGGGGYTGGGGGNGASTSYSGLGGGGGGTFLTGSSQSAAASNTGMGYVTITLPDFTSPTFSNNSTFTVQENIATSATAATIRVSEWATFTISSGADSGLFTITATDTSTAIVKFKNSPDYEAPTDVGGDNVYELTISATDDSNNVGTQAITITVTDVLDTSGFNSFALAGNATSAIYRTSVQINANVTVSSKVTFRAGNLVIPGCKSLQASGSGSTFTVSCQWKPSIRGWAALSATLVPTDSTISGAKSQALTVGVLNRSGKR